MGVYLRQKKDENESEVSLTGHHLYRPTIPYKFLFVVGLGTDTRYPFFTCYPTRTHLEKRYP